MKEIKDKEILKLDEILIFLNDNKRFSFEKSFLATKFDISVDQYEFLYNCIIEFSITEQQIGNILDLNTRYPSIVCNFLTERFIQSGGFKKYFQIKKEKTFQKEQQNVSKQKITAKKIIINNNEITGEKSEKKTKRNILGVLLAVIAILTFIFGDNVYEKIKNYDYKSEQNQIKKYVEYNEKISVPYLESKPILDKGLFFQQYYGNFLFGGPNIGKVKINARKDNGEKIKFTKDDDGNLIFDIFENPYIEFYYKNEYYSMQIQTLDSGQTFECFLKKIKKPTLDLIDVQKI